MYFSACFGVALLPVISETPDLRYLIINNLPFLSVFGFDELECLHRRVQRLFGSSSRNLNHIQDGVPPEVLFLQNERNFEWVPLFSV